MTEKITPKTPDSGDKPMDLKEVKRVIQMVEEAQISHLTLEMQGIKIEVKKEFGQTVVSHHVPVAAHYPQQQAVAQPSPVAVEAQAEAKRDDKLVAIKAQMVGTFYTSSKPGADPFVKAGDRISQGQVVCIIEAMKLFNEIESEYNGVIEKMCVENGTPIEYGQELFLIRIE